MKWTQLRFVIPVVTLLSGCLPMPGGKQPQETAVQELKEEKPAATEAVAEKSAAAQNLGLTFSKERTLTELRQNLDGKDPVQKAHAAMGLAYFEDQDSADAIRKLLQDRNPVVQKAAIGALSKLQDKRNLQVFYVLYQRSDNLDVRLSILDALAVMHDDSTVAFLQKQLPAMPALEASRAYDLLTRLDPPKPVSRASNRVDLDSFVISGVIGRGDSAKIQVDRNFFGLGDTILGFTIRGIDAVANIVRLEKDGKIVSKEIDTSAAEPAEKAISRLNSGVDSVVLQAVLELIYYQSGLGGQELIGLVEGANPEDVRLAAIYAIGLTGVSGAEDALRRVIKREKRADFLAACVLSLTMLGDENALDVLEPLSQHSDPWVRNAVVTAMGILASPHGVATLVRMLNDTYGFVRNNSAEQLMSLAVSGGMKNQIVPMLLSLSQTAESIPTRRTVQRLLDYLRGVIGQDGPEFSLTTSTSVQNAEPVVVKPVYTPTFVLLSIGQFGSKVIANVDVNGEQRNVSVGATLDGLEVIRIDPDDEFLHLKLSDGRVAVVEKGAEDDSKAQVFEIRSVD